VSEWPGVLPPFLWGVATSSHQVEGHQPGNDWTDWERAGRTREPSGQAADHWHRYADDMRLFAALGANAYRFSLEWSRLEPEPGRFDPDAFRHYRQMLGAARSAGLEPLVTLWHFTVPRWFSAAGGWLGPEAVQHFVRFAGRAVRELPDVRLWCTVNEPSVLAVMAYLQGVWPPGHRRLGEARRVLDRQLEAHRRAYQVIKDHAPDALVGLAHHLIHFRPWADTAVNRAMARFADRLFNAAPVRAVMATQDYLGVNYYTCRYADWRRPLDPRPHRPNSTLTDMGWEEDPEGLQVILETLAGWNKPILVTENGIATDDEERRVRFIEAHVEALARARRRGADVRGYFYWSGLDNFEWLEGYRPHFGLYAVEPDLSRRRKAGADAFFRRASAGPPEVSER
jgi:beta-glucosidase